ncbi:hypothetical protein FRC02_006007 [Tulasnella sp. 418]|nr:hypothetical protein FRC02_006007 [Tulasnella sp. 418]
MLQKAKNAAFLAEQQRAATESAERPKVEEADETVIPEEATEKNVGQKTTTEKKRFWLF